MPTPSSLSRPIIESLYSEALLLADEVRYVFAVGLEERLAQSDDLTRLAMSAEGLRTTTRVMHVLAWLLNQRAYFAGDLNELQLRRHGHLPADRPSERDQLAMLEPATRELVEETRLLHERIARLDEAWRGGFSINPGVRGLHERLNRRLALQDDRLLG